MRNFSLKTKANSHHRHNARLWQIRLLFVGVVFLILFLGRNVVGSLTTIATTPIFALQHYLETSSAAIPVYFRERSALESEIRRLEEELRAKEGTMNILGYIERENEQLRSLLGAGHTPGIVAGVISRPPHSPYDTLIIDKGKGDGVVTGAPVYYGSGMTLGYVRAVHAQQALVTLFSSPGVETTVYIFGPDIFTTAYGEGGGVVRLSIPQGIEVSEGDIVTLPSLVGGVLGKVDVVESVPTEPEQHAYLTLETPMQSIRLVRVSTRAYTPVSFEEALRAVEGLEEELFTVPIPEAYTEELATSTPNEESI